MEESHKFPPIIELNVGGQLFTTTLLTLTKCPDNMLAAMFSGNYSTVQDKDGRYFIDADGASFIHVLNFLRYGDIPSQKLAEAVYREAAYFGIHELVTELEKYPQILAKIQRNNFRKQFPGYQDCLEAIIRTASNETHAATTDVKLLLYSDENVVEENSDFNKFHVCVCEALVNNESEKKTFPSDAKLGPWKSDCTEKDVLNCLIFDLESQGFTITARYFWQCSYKCEDAGRSTQCCKSFYNICFHWWKSS